MRLVYILLAYLLAPVLCSVMLWRGLRDRSYWQDFGERFGFGPGIVGEASLWVHAVSLGEVQAAAALVRALRERHPDLPLVLTTVTPTGKARARALFASDPRVLVRYVPYDLPGSVRRFFERVRPRVAIILETEIWPNLYHACGQRAVPLVLASARISPRSVGRYRRLAGLFGETLSHGIVIAAQSEGDAQRFRSIGAHPARTHVTGNIKFDFELPGDIAVRGAELRSAHARDRPIWVAGSTHEGEESPVLEAHARLRSGGLDALLVLAPRHPARFDEVAAMLAARGFEFARRSRAQSAAGKAVLLLDTLGELVSFYAASDVAFVGGSLVPVGGHNLLESAALGVPTLSGPHVFNAEDIAARLVEEQAVQIVADGSALADALDGLLRDGAQRRERGAAGRRAVERNRGALARLLALLHPVIENADVEGPGAAVSSGATGPERAAPASERPRASSTSTPDAAARPPAAP